MTEPLRNLEELGRRAVACKGWRWLPGVRDLITGYRILAVEGSRIRLPAPLTKKRSDDGWYDAADDRWCFLPDLSDPATGGCLLVLLTPPPQDGYFVHVLPPVTVSPTWKVLLNLASEGIVSGEGTSIGRACADVAVKIGRWPGGER